MSALKNSARATSSRKLELVLAALSKLEPGSGSNNPGSFYLSTIRDESFEFRLIFCHQDGPLSKTFFSTDRRNQIFFSPNKNFSTKMFLIKDGIEFRAELGVNKSQHDFGGFSSFC